MSLISLDLREESMRILAENEALNRTEAERVAEESPEGAKKTFTQAEVNEIVRERIRRERAKTAPTPEEAKMQELADRELRLQKRTWLIDNDLPADDLMSFFDGIDLGSMEAFADTVRDLLTVLDRIRDYAERLRQQEAAGIRNSTSRGESEEKSILRQIFVN